MDDDFEWDSLRATVNEQIGSSILAQTSRALLYRLKFKMYGMFFQKIDHHFECDCGDETEHTHRVVNKVAFAIFRSRGGEIAFHTMFNSVLLTKLRLVWHVARSS